MVLYDVVSGSPPQVDTDIHKILVFHGRRGCEAIVSYHLKTVMAKDNLETRRAPCGASCIMHRAQCRDVDFPQILATRLGFDLNYHVRCTYGSLATSFTLRLKTHLCLPQDPTLHPRACSCSDDFS